MHWAPSYAASRSLWRSSPRVDIHAEHSPAFLQRLKETLPWDTLDKWTTESLLARLEQIAPGFQRWADNLQCWTEMKASKANAAPRNVDEYIAGFPPHVQEILEKIRTTIRKAAPAAEESISYQIPTLKLNGPLIYYAAHKTHIGLYPMTAGVKERFKKELATLQGSKGTVRFPLDKPIPYTLISRIVKFRIKENLEKIKKRK